MQKVGVDLDQFKQQGGGDKLEDEKFICNVFV